MSADAGPEAVTVDQLVQRLDVMLDHLGKTSQTQTVIHKSSVGGFVAGVAVALCVGSFFYTMDVSRTLKNEIRDLTAWKDIFGRDLAATKQQLQNLEKKP